MRTLRTLATLALAATGIAAPARAQQPSPAPSPAPQRLPVFPGGVEQVVVDVVVVDERGQAVPGLTAEDFALSEDGGARPILSFEAVTPEDAAPPAAGAAQARLTRAFALVFDDVHLTAAAGERVKAALRELLTTVLRDSDEVALVRTSSGETWSGRLGTDRASLLAALEGARGLRPQPKSCEMSDEEAMRIAADRDQALRLIVFQRYVKCGFLIEPPVPLVDPGGPRAAPPPLKPGEGAIETSAADQHQRTLAGIRSTYGMLERLLRALAPLRGRKSVILASEGFVRDRGMTEVKGLVTAASEANAAVYFLDARQLTARALTSAADTPASADASELGRLNQGRFFGAEATELLAEETGGRTIAGGELAVSLRRLSDESRSYYLLGYAPGDPALDGRFRAIKVAVRRPGLSVRARRGYYAVQRAGPQPANVAATVPRPLPETAPAAGPSALAAYARPLPEARAEVEHWSAEQVQKSMAALRSTAATDDLLAAAALAHAAAALDEAQEHHARAAAQAAALVRDAGRRTALERRLLLGLAHRFLDARKWQVAQELAEQATVRMAEDADAQLALGIVLETTGSVVDGGHRPNPDQTILAAGFDEMVSRNPVTGFAAGVPGGPAPGMPQFQGRMSRPRAPTAEARLRRAADTYRKALKVRPDLTEARLRLGRTLALLGEDKPAAQELDAVAAQAAEPELAYLALLFLGDLREQQGDFAGAAAQYRAAAQARPHSAVARLAAARALHASGDRGAADALVQGLLLEPADASGDPWWRYRLRPLGRWGDALADLRS